MKKIILLILLALVVYYLYINHIKKEEWSGYFYPNANDLSEWIESPNKFDNIYACRSWAQTKAATYILENHKTTDEPSTDYECGLNCKIDDDFYGMNVCEETIR